MNVSDSRRRAMTVVTLVATAVCAAALLGGSPAASAGPGSAPVRITDAIDQTRVARVSDQGALSVTGALMIDGPVGTFPAPGSATVQGGDIPLSLGAGGLLDGRDFNRPFSQGLNETQSLALTSVTFSNSTPDMQQFALFLTTPCVSPQGMRRFPGFDFVVEPSSTLHLTFPQPALIFPSDDTEDWCPVWIREIGGGASVAVLTIGHIMPR